MEMRDYSLLAARMPWASMGLWRGKTKVLNHEMTVDMVSIDTDGMECTAFQDKSKQKHGVDDKAKVAEKMEPKDRCRIVDETGWVAQRIEFLSEKGHNNLQRACYPLMYCYADIYLE